ncbi:hypothetical protein [Streptomyces filamentosus]|uniref:hypothetical protein n=1 Tax=Streptomyces filamentosus TaxID=67294 RepID=UPI0012387023|nr:hypothetical protein [Streptomyces filamentosus]KAA6217430.1 hypothetical protein CP979_11100 [Streptomyces filamentosus]
MNAITYWTLIALAVAVEVWGQVIDNGDVTLVGVIAGLGVIAVHCLLLRADRFEESVEAGEER